MNKNNEAAEQRLPAKGRAMSEQPTYTAEQIMEQAQVFASAWALVGTPLDTGDQLEAAEVERDMLAAMLAHSLDAAQNQRAQP